MKSEIALHKNDRVCVTIEDIGVSGEGIGKVDGFPLFIKDTIPQDQVEVIVTKVKKGYGYGRLERIVETSPFRVEPPCPMHRRCGGCQIQSMDYGQQLVLKEKLVRNNLMRIGGIENPVLEPIIGMTEPKEEPFHYRNKAQYPVGYDRERHLITGFYAGRTHDIIPYRSCALGVVENEAILDQILDFMEAEHITAYEEQKHQGLVRHILIRKAFATGQIMVCLVINGNQLPSADKLIRRLEQIPGMTSISISINKQDTNVIMGNKIQTIWGEPVIKDKIGDIVFEISPLSFFQVNPIQTKKLYEKALEYAKLDGTQTVWDLYCGIGTISLFLAQKAKQVYGIEIIPQAIEDAKRNATSNKIQNVDFYVGKAEEVLPELYRTDASKRGDVVVVDPPRKGLEPQVIDTILQMKPERVVYVSCDSATLARDVKLFLEGGYELKKIQPLDMFPQTVHVEVVVMLSRTEGTTRAL